MEQRFGEDATGGIKEKEKGSLQDETGIWTIPAGFILHEDITEGSNKREFPAHAREQGES